MALRGRFASLSSRSGERLPTNTPTWAACLLKYPWIRYSRSNQGTGLNQFTENTPIQAPEIVWPFGGRDVEEGAGPDALANIKSKGSTLIRNVEAFAVDAAMLGTPNPHVINHAADNVRDLHAMGLTGRA